MSATAPLLRPAPGAATDGGSAKPMRAAYIALVFFLAIYCARPEDWIPGLAALHLDKIAGGLAIAAAGFTVLGGGRKLGLPRSMKCLILLFLQLAVSALFSPIWRGGATEIVINQFSKIVLIAIVITWTATSVLRVRTLLFVQVATVVMVGLVSVRAAKMNQGRLEGVLGGSYANSNDLALALAIAIPICMGLMLLSRSKLRKLLWAAGIGVLIYAVTLTFSRGGLLALLLGISVCVWDFGIKGKRKWLPIAVVAAIATLLSLAPAGYGARVATIFQPDTDPTGSAQQRMGLQQRSVEVTLEHPLLGVGAGNFEIISGNWHVTHDSFTQMSSEGGVPALILYLMILWYSFKDLQAIRRESGDPSVRILASALRAALAAYVLGSLFASVVYLFFPYLMFGYICALRRVSAGPDAAPAPPAPAAAGRKEFACAG